MSNRFSLYIKDDNLLEDQKVKKRQELVRDLHTNSNKQTNSNLEDLFNINFPIERAGNNNCENMIGSIEIPLGLAGPVKVDNFIEATADREFSNRNFGVVGGGVMNATNTNDAIVDAENTATTTLKNIFIPLATTEGALIASINRGCKALNLSQNLSVVVKKVGMTRALIFECKSTMEAYKFIDWMKEHEQTLVDHCENTSKHLKFLFYQSFIRGRYAYLRFNFDTGEAMGMNMITMALKYMWDKIKSNHSKVKLLSLSGNVCTDKKDSVLNRIFGRGFNVELEVFLSKKILSSIFNVNAKDLVKNHVAKNLIGSNVAGSLSQNMHVANALSAFYVATGQDVAHVVGGSEASVTFEEKDDGVYVALTLPTISVGSVGGGTWFPKQTQARSLILLGANESARKNNQRTDADKNTQVNSVVLALAAGLAALAGEISGLCALTNQSLANAHQKLARNNKC